MKTQPENFVTNSARIKIPNKLEIKNYLVSLQNKYLNENMNISNTDLIYPVVFVNKE